MADQENWKKVKGVWKRTKDLASKGALGTGGEGWKKKKKKDYVTDPDATFGGKRIKKQGPEIKVSNTQADLSKRKRLGLKRGSGRGGRMKDLPDHLRHSLVNQAKHRATHKSGGRIGLKHGGSAGAAKRGHGAEIK